MLRAAGLRTVEAASGGEGIALAAERLPDVILLDLELPDMDGMDVARELRDGARDGRASRSSLSARGADDGDASRLHAARFAGYLEKPIDVREFPAQVRSFCARRTLSRVRPAGVPAPPSIRQQSTVGSARGRAFILRSEH